MITENSRKSIHICYVIMSLGPAGAEHQLLEIIRHASQNIKFSVCHFGLDNTLGSKIAGEGAEVVDLGFRVPYDPVGLGRLFWYCNRNDVDLIHGHLPPAVIVGRFAGMLTSTPVVSTHHNVPENYQIFSRSLERFTRRFDRRTIAVSEGVKYAHLRKEHNDQWATIYNGIDVDEYSSRVESANRNPELDTIREENDSVFLNIARYAPQKRQTDLITAFANARHRLNSSHLIIVGWGKLESELHRTTREEGVSSDVTITGRVPQVEPYYAMADIFVSSSSREGLPITFLEAMASKLPILATNIPGVREIIVDEKTGLLIPPAQPMELAKGMVSICKDYDRNHMGEEAYKRASSSFTIENTVSEHLQLYENILGHGYSED